MRALRGVGKRGRGGQGELGRETNRLTLLLPFLSRVSHCHNASRRVHLLTNLQTQPSTSTCYITDPNSIYQVYGKDQNSPMHNPSRCTHNVMSLDIVWVVGHEKNKTSYCSGQCITSCLRPQKSLHQPSGHFLSHATSIFFG